MRNYHIPPKPKDQKITGLELIEQRIEDFMDILLKEKQISNYDMQRILKLGDGQYERLVRKIKENHSDTAQWIKKEKIWKYTPLTLAQAQAKQKQKLEKEILT